MVENSNPGADSKQGESALGRRRRERILCVGKRGVYPSLYRPRGAPSSSPPPCGTKPPKGGGVGPDQGGGAPPLDALPKGGKPPPPQMRPYGHLGLFPPF